MPDAGWEYRFMRLSRKVEFPAEALTSLGREGWEAIAYTGRTVLFKRRLPMVVHIHATSPSDGER